MIHSPDADTNFFDIVIGVLWGDILASYMFIICLDCIPEMSIHRIKENGFIWKKSKLYPIESITDACCIQGRTDNNF